MRESTERGAAMFLIVITILIVLFASAFAIDLASTSRRGQQLQNAADAAALAGVQAFRASINDRATEAVPEPVANAADEAAALAAVNLMLEANGVTGLTPQLSFPDALADTQVRVTLTDPSGGGRLLSGFTGGDGQVSRDATATFKSCSSTCARTIGIPSPFLSVNAKGEGDGYKPIPVGDRLYALNHNNNQITCVERTTQQACWCVNKVTGLPCDGLTEEWEERSTRYAYAGTEPHSDKINRGQWNPEMPHAAVFNTTIWWSTSDSDGHHMFCWETDTDSPCSLKYTLTTKPRATYSQISSSKDQNRGGGTVIVNNLIYVFTDNHEIHCFNPVTRAICFGYAGPVESALGAANFPANEPNDDNHGGSIDRIVDSSGNIYSTLHIKRAVAIDGPYDCSQNLQDIVGKRVIVRLASSPASSSDPWISGDTTDPNSSNKTIRTSSDGNDIKDRWDVADEGGGYVSLSSAVNGRYWDADGNGNRLETSSSVALDDEWLFTDWDPVTRTYMIQNHDTDDWIGRDGSVYRTYANKSSGDRFSVNHWQCEVSPAPPQGAAPLLPYAEGTWLQCFNTTTKLPCSPFTPTRIHEDGSRFSGRLFFFRDSSGTETGVCSTGFHDSIDDHEFEIKCVSMAGIPSPSMPDAMNNDFKAAIVGSLNQYPAAWGDPHWNEYENRLFYPTQHGNSRVLCWDFDSINGWCNWVTGDSPLGYIEDYGFYSEGNCVYGLGHRARFWAFKASDLGEACTGSQTEAIIRPCACSRVYEWGKLNFNIDLSPYVSFDILIEDRNGTVIWPKNWVEGDPGHSLFYHGLSIDLTEVPVDPLDPSNDFLVVKVQVENADGVVIDPNGEGVQQTFEIEFEQSPRLSG